MVEKIVLGISCYSYRVFSDMCFIVCFIELGFAHFLVKIWNISEMSDHERSYHRTSGFMKMEILYSME